MNKTLWVKPVYRMGSVEKAAAIHGLKMLMFWQSMAIPQPIGLSLTLKAKNRHSRINWFIRTIN